MGIMSLYKCYRQGTRQSDSFGQSYDEKSQGRVVIMMNLTNIVDSIFSCKRLKIMASANLKGVLNYYSLLIHAFSGGGKGSSLQVPGSLYANHSLHHLFNDTPNKFC